MIPYKQIEQAGHFESPISSEMSAALMLWAQMYQGKAPWLSDGDGMRNLNLPAAICSELARQVLMEMKWSVTGTGKDADGNALTNPRAEYVSEQFKRCTGITLREKLEQGMASGGIIIKPYPLGEKIYIDFSPDWCVYPVSFDGDNLLTDVIFADSYTDGKEFFTRLERHTAEGDSTIITHRCFRSSTQDAIGTECSLKSVPIWESLEPKATITGTRGKPLFGWYRVAAANTADLDTILSPAVFAKAVDCIRDADEQWSRIQWEFKAKETAIDVDPSVLLPKAERGLDGKHYEMPKLNARLFRAIDLGADSTYNVFDPPIRDASLLNGMNAILCRVEDLCGLARGTFSDPNTQAMTATQIKMMKQRTYETISANQHTLEEALRDVVNAIDVYASALNLAPPGELEVSFEWDDSVITDTEQQLNERVMLLNAGVMSKAEVRQWYLGETEAQAQAAILKIQHEQMQSMIPDELQTDEE